MGGNDQHKLSLCGRLCDYNRGRSRPFDRFLAHQWRMQAIAGEHVAESGCDYSCDWSSD